MPNTPPSAQPTYAYLAKPTAGRLDILADQCLRILSGGNVTADSPWDRREVKLLCEQTLVSLQGEIDRLNTERKYKDAVDREAFGKAQYFHDLEAIYKYGGTSDDHVVTLLNWPVHYDADQQVYYSLLPEGWLNLARYRNLPGEEVPRSVEAMKMSDRRRPGRRYIPLQKGQERIIEGLQGNLGFYLGGTTGERIEFYCDPERDFPDTVVKIERVLRPERDVLPSPGLLQDAQDDMVIPKVVATLMRKGQEDKANDSNAAV